MTIKAKKSLSQNFLINHSLQTSITSKMRELIDLNNFAVLEIGPGRGELTQHLLTGDRKLYAIEIDLQAATVLSQKLSTQANFKLIQDSAKDIFLADKSKFFDDLGLPSQFTFVSNLPFHIGSRILVDLPVYFYFNNFGVILQYEVATKLDSRSDPTFFGFWLNLFYEISDIKKIAKGNFLPAPKVDCGYVCGVSRFKEGVVPEFLSTPELRLKARQTLKQLFSSPRKSIINNLKGFLSQEQIQQTKLYLENKDQNRLTWQNYREILEFVCSF
jgi:16S rRNA (adenine1518-N6/adenine1519-N6)-dimethyltransferase